ncbi:hypothetical protein TRVA0_003S00782 [Trichomonascus vanleenenianus]|uniref:Smn1p n=1 Tax=Trichomonascus vanleenenianus TaxID=2268995 RepID=UPI003ECAB4BA
MLSNLLGWLSLATALPSLSREPTVNDEVRLRDIQWGQVNLLQTTDIHGWLPGHLNEPTFSADWGDYVSLVQHMRRHADERGVDLIVVDTGDRLDGNGFSDASSPQAKYSREVFKMADLDIVTIGNHELYRSDVSVSEYTDLYGYFGDRYVVSNVDIKTDNGSWVPLGNRYLQFTTKHQKLNVLAFSFIFDFTKYNDATRVRMVEKAIREDWFQEALRIPNIDLFVVAGHVPVRDNYEFLSIVREIRKVHPTTPIQGLGGHTHIRDFVEFDKRAVAIESGRYFETIGWASVEGIDRNGGPNDRVAFSRMYIDTNRASFAHHSNTSLSGEPGEVPFDTEYGIHVTKRIQQFRELLNISTPLAYIPKTYYMQRAPYPGDSNVYSLLEDKVLPTLSGMVHRDHRPRMVTLNTGSIRYDLIEGEFTRDSEYILNPFPNKWLYIKDIPRVKAEKIIALLNKLSYILPQIPEQGATIFLNESDPQAALSMDKRSWPEELDAVPIDQNRLVLNELPREETPGYRTIDDFGSDGDDTPHIPWKTFPIPNVIVGRSAISDETRTVDLVFNDYLRSFIVETFMLIGYEDEIHEYGGLSPTKLLVDYFN